MHSNYQLSPRNRLRSLFEESNLTLSTRDVKALGIRLAHVIGRAEPYSRRQLISVLNGKFPASKNLSMAIDALLAETDGADPYLIVSTSATVYHPPEHEISGSYIMSDSKVCPNCGRLFVPNVPWREVCPICNPPRRKA